ncbi:uncharacterized protein LOC134346628 isoform X2 [Mobula hypostoma]|uniref:uncharacterized protein LOC134346628 isoform X2 n=1 Tax=Mobula hypostoma TaxID=723540 RepID=UPI002FC2D410
MYFLSAFVFTFIPSLLLIGVTSQNPVRQMPSHVQLLEGQTATINCTADFHGGKTCTWLKDDLKVSESVWKFRERVSERREIVGQKLSTFLEIRNLTECDSATYYCELSTVDSKKKGDGTKIIVRRAPQSNAINMIFIGVSAGVIAALVIALIIVSAQLRWRTKACIALQRQFVHYITEKSTEYLKINKTRHGVREDGSASSNQERRKKKKRKTKKSNSVDCTQQGNIQ